MDLNLIEEQLAGQFSGSWVTHNFKAGDAAVRISFGQNHKGMPTYRYWYEESRVERQIFLTLTCTQTLCSVQQETMNRWRLKTGFFPALIKKPTRPAPVHITRLAEEVVIERDGQPLYARQANVQKVFNCPQEAHPPRRVSTPAWDLFTMDGHFVATVPNINTLQPS
ncbi:MAG: hypothetical protein K9J50_03405 [Sulfuritalea sp.]|nr:hypothetical protein [Sulfuritalea sp.]